MGGVDGKTLITALVLGVDVINRISLAIRRPLSWIRTATCGSFGAAAAAGKILGLDRGQMQNALGVVYSQTSGNAQGLLEGRLIKRMQPGLAAQAGVLSAFLAREGITGSHEFLEGAYGFYNLYERGEYDPAPVTPGFGPALHHNGPEPQALSLLPHDPFLHRRGPGIEEPGGGTIRTDQGH